MKKKIVQIVLVLTMGYFLQAPDDSNSFRFSLEGLSYRESTVPTHIRTYIPVYILIPTYTIHVMIPEAALNQIQGKQLLLLLHT